jgi:two-component system cell cycle response regulator DivK
MIAQKKDVATAPPIILVVDDYDETRFLYAEYLEFCGFRTITACNGAEAIEKAIAEHPSVIAMDLAMPEMDGWEAMRRLKVNPVTSDIYIIAVTGHDEASFIERASDAGCDRYLAKPCLPEALRLEVMAALDARRRTSLAAAARDTAKTYWDVYLEVRSSRHARTPSELGKALATNIVATKAALAALDAAHLVYSAVIGGVPLTYVVGKAARTDADARALAAEVGLDTSIKVAN